MNFSQAARNMFTVHCCIESEFVVSLFRQNCRFVVRERQYETPVVHLVRWIEWYAHVMLEICKSGTSSGIFE